MSAKLKPVTRRTRDATLAPPVPTAAPPPLPPAPPPHVSRASSSAPRDADGCAKCSGMDSGTAVTPARLRSSVLCGDERRRAVLQARAQQQTQRGTSAPGARAGSAPRATRGRPAPPGGASRAALARSRRRRAAPTARAAVLAGSARTRQLSPPRWARRQTRAARAWGRSGRRRRRATAAVWATARRRTPGRGCQPQAARHGDARAPPESAMRQSAGATVPPCARAPTPRRASAPRARPAHACAQLRRLQWVPRAALAAATRTRRAKAGGARKGACGVRPCGWRAHLVASRRRNARGRERAVHAPASSVLHGAATRQQRRAGAASRRLGRHRRKSAVASCVGAGAPRARRRAPCAHARVTRLCAPRSGCSAALGSPACAGRHTRLGGLGAGATASPAQTSKPIETGWPKTREKRGQRARGACEAAASLAARSRSDERAPALTALCRFRSSGILYKSGTRGGRAPRRAHNQPPQRSPAAPPPPRRLSARAGRTGPGTVRSCWACGAPARGRGERV
jgi:hypothetical protein